MLHITILTVNENYFRLGDIIKCFDSVRLKRNYDRTGIC